MIQSKWVYPIVFLVFSIAALATSLILYIYWYLEVSEGLQTMVERFKIDQRQVLEPQTWVVILVLSILVGFILICIFTIFVYNQKNLQLYRMQQNFINNFTHELKTPVTSLKLFLETFEKHELSRNDQLKYIGYMIQDADRLSDNISSILDLAKVENKSYGGEYTVRNLVQVVDRFFKNNGHLFQNSEININNPSGDSFLYAINRKLFEILLMNLSTNALKYNESKLPKIDITFNQLKNDLLIRFEDNGIGLEKSEIRKIFRKFYQVGRSDNRTAKGSGLGLFMAKIIARLHKGKIKAESRGRGKGSVFTLILPYNSEMGIQNQWKNQRENASW